MNLDKLKRHFEGTILTDEDSLESVSSDFGRMVCKMPVAIASPQSAEDVRCLIELANQEDWLVSVRGNGHSQSGQSLNQGGVLLDMLSLNSVIEITDSSVWVDAGILWCDLVDELLPRGLVPPVLTNNLNVSVGGTVSMAGLGVASHRYGAQADNVEALEVVTGAGDLVQCSPTENSELFNVSRCGLGQFSVITKVKLKLRKCQKNVRTYFLLYDDVKRLMADQELILRGQLVDFVEGWCSPCVQGLRRLQETKVPFAEWFYPLQLTVEFDTAPPVDALLRNLNFYRLVHKEDSTLRDFLFRMEPVFDIWRETGSWRLLHPWMEIILPWERAAEYIEGVLKSFPPGLITGGHVLLWPCRGDIPSSPLFQHPPGEFVMGFGILPAVPRRLLPMTSLLLNKASDLGIQLGGKRYLSGWVEFDHSGWKEHFGETWSSMVQSKSFFDPNRVLDQGFVKYFD